MSSSTPVSRVEEITATLRNEILRGQYRPGERLPSERDLAARFEANRGAIRESLKKLEQLGIADIRPGGVRVVPIEEASLSILRPLLEVSDVPDTQLVSHLLDVWGVLLAMVTRSSVSEASEQDLLKLAEIAEQLVDRHSSVSCTEKSDHDEAMRHSWLSLATELTRINNNLVLRLILNGIMNQFIDRDSRPEGLELNFDFNRRKRILDQLAKGFRNRDPELAADAITQHFQLTKETVLPALEHLGSQAKPNTIGVRS